MNHDHEYLRLLAMFLLGGMIGFIVGLCLGSHVKPAPKVEE